VDLRFVTSTAPDSLAAELRTPPRAVAPATEALPPVEIVDDYPSIRETIVETFRSRHLFWQIGSSTILGYFTRYRLGPFWLFFQVFMSVAGYSVIFGGGIFNVKAPNGMPYFLFMMVGMMGWQLFNTTLMISARSFLRLKSMIKDIHFPLVVVPIAGSAQALMRFFILFAGYVGAVIWFWVSDGKLYAQIQPRYLFLSALGLVLCVALAWGVSLWTAPLTVHTRDTRFVIRYMLPFLMFVTPVFYPIEKLHGKTRLIAELNPLSSPVEMAKVGLLGAGSVRPFAAIWSIVTISLVFASGIWFLNRFGPRVVGLRDAADEDEDELLL
jgi:lipopolysaccharide transport system permease protein